MRPFARGVGLPSRSVGVAAVFLAFVLAGCSVLPKPFEPAERERLAADTQSALFSGQEPLLGPLTLSDAMARSIKYQADYRQKQMEAAVAVAQVVEGFVRHAPGHRAVADHRDDAAV